MALRLRNCERVQSVLKSSAAPDWKEGATVCCAGFLPVLSRVAGGSALSCASGAKVNRERLFEHLYTHSQTSFPRAATSSLWAMPLQAVRT